MLANKSLSKEQFIIRLIRWLLLFKGVLFIVFAAIHLFRSNLLLAILFFVDAIIFLWLNRVIEKKKKEIFYFAVVFVGINIFLIIIDELGLPDFFVLALDAVIFVMILGNNKKLLDK